MPMPLHPSWADIGLRLALTMIAGAIIGINRGVRGHAAGLRTLMLVGLAAALSMIQANLLLSMGGKAPDSFGVMDLMRLPLGILTGVGFIGAGTILHRGDLVTGVTTAATLWVMTMIGLCLGGGQLVLGIAATGLVTATLWALAWLDLRLPRENRAILVLEGEVASVVALDKELSAFLGPLGYRTRFVRQRHGDGFASVPHRRVGDGAPVDAVRTSELAFEVLWRRADIDDGPLDLLQVVGERYPVVSFDLTSEVHGHPSRQERMAP